MANVRIKDLTTTAATTASDDFFGVDGATNGTRKLNAYSPTFGGNLTVSGTGTSSVAGKLTIGAVPTLIGVMSVRPVANGILNIRNAGEISANSGAAIDMLNDASDALTDFTVRAANYNFLNTGPVKVGGNLTVSGTGAITVNPNQNAETIVAVSNANSGSSAGSIYRLANDVSTTSFGMRSSGNAAFFALDAGSSYLWYNGTTSLVIGATNAAGVIKFNTGGLSETMRLNAAGKLLLKGDGVDSSNGKLQLDTHTTSAGGIGFGTDTSIYSNNSGQISIDHVNGTSPLLVLRGSGSNKAAFYSNTGNAYIDVNTAGGALYLRTNAGTLALTLDSSQNTLTAGKLYVKNADTGFDRIGAGTGALQSSGNTIAFWDANIFSMWSGKALRLGNAYVGTPQVSTGYVTIQDSSGTTYKVLVAT